MSSSRSDELRAQLLSGNRATRDDALVDVLTDFVNSVTYILRRRFWSLNHHDWEEIWSQAVWDLDRMVTDGKLAPHGDLHRLLLRLTRNRAMAYLKSKLRYHFRLAKLLVNAVDSYDKKYTMFALLEGIEAHAADMDESERLVLFTAVKLLNRCGAKNFAQLPMITLAGMVNMTANPQITPEQAQKILFRQWRYLRAFLQREGFNDE